MKNFEKTIEQFKHPVAKTTGKWDVVELSLSRPEIINTIMMHEGIRLGQRIRSYEVEGLVSGTWKTLFAGETVGYKPLQKFRPTLISAVRLKITGTTPLLLSAIFRYTI
jgi:alpha-L-fucosidase